nr:MAG TPA: hypothetical protein [Caudoviricetes sp.]
MRYIHVDIPHYVIVLFIFIVLIIQNQSYFFNNHSKLGALFMT